MLKFWKPWNPLCVFRGILWVWNHQKHVLSLHCWLCYPQVKSTVFKAAQSKALNWQLCKNVTDWILTCQPPGKKHCDSSILAVSMLKFNPADSYHSQLFLGFSVDCPNHCWVSQQFRESKRIFCVYFMVKRFFFWLINLPGQQTKAC